MKLCEINNEENHIRLDIYYHIINEDQSHKIKHVQINMFII